jgi:multidrug resistance protein
MDKKTTPSPPTEGVSCVMSDSLSAPMRNNADPETSNTNEALYSEFSNPSKILIVTMVSIGSFISPLSSLIYFPSLTTLATEFDVSISMINLTLTMYQIFQGLSPSLYGDLADQTGRRPAFIIAMIICVAANIGLAMQDSYAVLMVLRCLQSAGGSGTIALSLGVIADVTSPAERGLYIGIALAGTTLAAAIGPVIGGLLAEYLGWKSIFWFLVIFSGLYLIVYTLFVPETNRKIVGNGSIRPQTWFNKSGLDRVRELKSKKSKTSEDKSNDLLLQPRIGWPRPWKVFIVMQEKDVAILLIFNALLTAAWYDVVATTPSLFSKIYGFNNLQIGLCYL